MNVTIFERGYVSPVNIANHDRSRYRPDIDGLRAIAVLAVVLYHYGIGPLQGGFVGVDIFFVISGYLITGIIHKEIDRGEFTFADFYERRVRRIVPALFAMLLVTLVVGAWLLLPSDLVRLGNATLATLLFGANVLFWRQSGYFDTSSEYNPLLHTWSLAVEEQFYIGLPILLLLLHRFGTGRLKPVLAVCAIASFALCVWGQTFWPSATFFLSPFRAWELLLGGLLAIGVVPPLRAARVRLLVSVTALALLLWSLWWVEAGPAFPGWQAALPAIATAGLLHSGADGSSLVQRLLSLKPLVWIGLISYSLYLWHWPLVVFVRYRNGMESLAPAMGWLLLVVAILLAVASYRWVERPLRRRKPGASGPRRHRMLAGAALACVLLGGTAFATRLQDGWQTRFPLEVVALDEARSPPIPFVECSGNAPPHRPEKCVVGDRSSDRRILLWGDSYALAWAPAFDQLGKRHGFAVELAWLSQCPGLLGVDVSSSHPCKAFNDKVAARVARLLDKQLDTVVLVGSWGPYLDPSSGIDMTGEGGGALGNRGAFAAGLARTAELVASSGVHLVIIGPTPGAPADIPYRLAVAEAFGLRKPDGKSIADSRSYDARFWKIALAYGSTSKASLVDPLPWFEFSGRYRYTDQVGRLLYRDGGHLSIDGADFVASRFPAGVLGAAVAGARRGNGTAGQSNVGQ